MSTPSSERRPASRAERQPQPEVVITVPVDPETGEVPVDAVAGGQPLASARLLSKVLDDLIRIPGTRFTVGADGLLGLVPGVGDAATTAMAGVILIDAMRLKVPLPILARMALNLLLDAAIGQLPFVGDAADFAFRSNRMNLKLLERTVANRERTALTSTIYVAAALGLIVGTLLVLVAAIIWTVWWIGKVLNLW